MKRGFTLVEVLGVMLIISLLILFVIPAITAVIRNSRENLYEVQIKNIEKAAKEWGAENLSLLPDNSGESITIFLHNLKVDGFIDKSVNNPLNRDQIPGDLAIEIKRTGNLYNYTVIEESGGNILEYDAELFTIYLNGSLDETITLNSLFSVSVSDVVATDKDGLLIGNENKEIAIALDEVPVGSVDTSTAGEYHVLYTINYGGDSQSILRKITVVN